MGREIKFRAWDKENGVMIDGDSLAFEEYAPLADLLSQEGIMQYTGLKDKDAGQEIWQGDILKIPVDINNEFHGEYSLYEVIKMHGQWVVSYIRSETGAKLPRGYLRASLLNQYEYSAKLLYWSEDYMPHTKIEVIGNIYENPELIEV